jgi:hypothetical protein
MILSCGIWNLFSPSSYQNASEDPKIDLHPRQELRSLKTTQKWTLVLLNQQPTDIQMELLLQLVVQPKYRSSNKNIPVRT